MKEIIFASTNAGKIEELKRFIKKNGLEIKIISLLDLDGFYDIEETGKSYSENALIKAEYIFNKFNMPVISDDSGFEVYSLFGKEADPTLAVPGIYSARLFKDHDSSANTSYLMEKLNKIPMDYDNLSNNTFREGCAITTMCFIDSDGSKVIVEGITDGIFFDKASLSEDLNYRSIFLPKLPNGDYADKVYADMTKEEYSFCSHRTKAVEKLLSHL